MGRIRHWKQRYDPDAKFVFLKRLKLGLDPKKPVVAPGDPVPVGDIRLGRARIKRWWHAGIIGLADWVDPDVAKLAKRKEEREEITEAVEQVLSLIPATEKRLAELVAEKDAEDDGELAHLTGELEDMRAVLVKAKALGIAIPADALDTFDLPVEEPKGEGLLDPVEPPEGEVKTVTLEEAVAQGIDIEAIEGGFAVKRVDGEEGVFETIEEALTFAQGAPAVEGDAEVPPTEEILVEPTGGGWYAVTVPGEPEPRKVQGEKNLDALLVELGASE